MKNIFRTLLLLGFLGLGAGNAWAHFPWVNMANYSLEKGEAAYITLGWGHRYPLGKLLANKDVEAAFFIDPLGKKQELTATSRFEFAPLFSLNLEGSYVFAAQRKSGFYTKTTRGGKRQSKQGLRNVITCSLSHMSMKGLATVGEKITKVDYTVGHPLEIIPLTNPATVRAGDYLQVKVLLQGKPYYGRIYATPMGFSTAKDVFAYTAKTNRQGVGQIRILQPGVWLIKAEYRRPYPDPMVCDEEAFIATLTLEVK